MARLRSLIRRWLGVDKIEELDVAVSRALNVIARDITDLREGVRVTKIDQATLAAELIAAKRTTTQRIATSDEDVDPHMGYN